jgi:hypothetical protein
MEDDAAAVPGTTASLHRVNSTTTTKRSTSKKYA